MKLFVLNWRKRKRSETSANILQAQCNLTATIMAFFDAHCNSRQNETAERYIFTWNQAMEEGIDEYSTNLKMLATSCSFADIKDSLKRDRLVCGIQDVQDILLKETDLFLENKYAGLLSSLKAGLEP